MPLVITIQILGEGMGLEAGCKAQQYINMIQS